MVYVKCEKHLRLGQGRFACYLQCSSCVVNTREYVNIPGHSLDALNSSFAQSTAK